MTKRCSRGLGHPKPGQIRGQRPASTKTDPAAAGHSGRDEESGPEPCITARSFLPIRKRRDARDSGHTRGRMPPTLYVDESTSSIAE